MSRHTSNGLPVDPHVIAANGPADTQIAVATQTSKQQLAPSDDKSTTPNGRPVDKSTTPNGRPVEKSAAIKPSVSPSKASVGESHPSAIRPTSATNRGSDINLQITRDEVKSKPTSMLATEASVAKTAQQLELDPRAERYAELRTNPNTRLSGEVRLADLGGQPSAPATAAKTATTPPPGQSNNPLTGRMMAPANAVGDTPAGPAPSTATSGGQPPVVGLSAPTNTTTPSTLLTATDAAAPITAITREAGSATETARITATPRSQPTTTAKTVEQIAVQIKNGVNSGADKIHVRLQPAALGRVDIQLEVGHDQRVQAVIIVEKAETLEILERDARHLHRMLEDAGFRTDNESLTFRQQPTPDEQQPDGPGSNPSSMTDADDQNEQTADLTSQERISYHDGLLDVEV